MQLIALSEMVELPKEDAERIVYETRDLRQAMLTLQYHLISTFKPQVSAVIFALSFILNNDEFSVS